MSSAVTTQAHLPAKPLLAVDRLSKRFATSSGMLGREMGSVSAVDDVNLTIDRGETLALVGESGSGKSTLARLILRLVEPTSGSVRFGDIDVLSASKSELRTFRKHAQIIFQDPFESLDPRMKGEAIVSEGMHHLKMGKDGQRERVVELLDLVQLPRDAAKRFPHEFSGGQRQRLSIARSLAVEPDFIIADEPVSALDVSMQSQILNLMRDLQDRLGLTYLFISHDLSVVRHMANRVAVMYLGRMVETAPSEKLFPNPLHPYTQALLSAVPSVTPGKPSVRIRVTGEAQFTGNLAACRFSNRCPRVLDICRKERPPLVPVEPGSDHEVACFNFAPLAAPSEAAS